MSVLLILTLSITASTSAGPFKKAGAAFAIAATAKHLAKKRALKASARQKDRISLAQRLKQRINQKGSIAQRLKNKRSKQQRKANLRKVLSSFKPSEFKINGTNILIDKAGMKHILQRHHPRFRKGRDKQKQTLLPKDMTIRQMKSIMHEVLKQNKTRVSQIGSGRGTILGVVNGVKYQLALKGGRIGQFFNR